METVLENTTSTTERSVVDSIAAGEIHELQAMAYGEDFVEIEGPLVAECHALQLAFPHAQIPKGQLVSLRVGNVVGQPKLNAAGLFKTNDKDSDIFFNRNVKLFHIEIVDPKEGSAFGAKYCMNITLSQALSALPDNRRAACIVKALCYARAYAETTNAKEANRRGKFYASECGLRHIGVASDTYFYDVESKEELNPTIPGFKGFVIPALFKPQKSTRAGSKQILFGCPTHGIKGHETEDKEGIISFRTGEKNFRTLKESGVLQSMKCPICSKPMGELTK